MRKGFSLVELSIVLVILGLLVGGILAGKSLIRAAEVRKTISDMDKYKTTLFAFRDKYFGLPGDITNGSKFWAAADDGNGDGRIYAYSEQVSLWEMLSLSGMVEGSYDGVWDASGYNPPGSNCPMTSNGQGCFIVEAAITTAQQWSIYQNMNNHFRVGGVSSTHVAGTGGLFTTGEAWNIDTKMDDGLGQYGKIMASSGTGASPYCINNSTSNAPNPAVDYYLTGTNLSCILYYYF